MRLAKVSYTLNWHINSAWGQGAGENLLPLYPFFNSEQLEKKRTMLSNVKKLRLSS
jgi:hypothetical protein